MVDNEGVTRGACLESGCFCNQFLAKAGSHYCKSCNTHMARRHVSDVYLLILVQLILSLMYLYLSYKLPLFLSYFIIRQIIQLVDSFFFKPNLILFQEKLGKCLMPGCQCTLYQHAAGGAGCVECGHPSAIHILPDKTSKLFI